jgi:hypothetical protein
MRTLLNQLQVRLILGALLFLLELTGAVVLVVRDSLLFSAHNMTDARTHALLEQKKIPLLEIAKREALISAPGRNCRGRSRPCPVAGVVLLLRGAGLTFPSSNRRSSSSPLWRWCWPDEERCRVSHDRNHRMHGHFFLTHSPEEVICLEPDGETWRLRQCGIHNTGSLSARSVEE